MFYLGIAVMVGGLFAIVGLLFARRELGMGAILGLGTVAAFMGLLLIELPSIHQVVIGLGEGKSVGVNFQNVVDTVTSKANQVQTDTAEVKALKKQIAQLADRVADSQHNIAQTESNLFAMQTAIKDAMREFIEMYFIDMNTRNIIGAPSKDILAEMNPRLLALEAFAYDTPQQREAAFAHMHEVINKVEAPLMPKATPTVASRPAPTARP